MQLHPLADRIVARQVEAPTKTVSGILLPPTAGDRPLIGDVLAVGKNIVEVKVGDKVWYSKADYKLFDEIKVDGKEVVGLKEAAVIAIVKE